VLSARGSMSDKKKQPKAQHGGPRPHPPGREGGRPKSPHPLRIIKIACTEEEYQAILELSTRERTERLMRKSDGLHTTE
jgi:hypothetical protein